MYCICQKFGHSEGNFRKITCRQVRQRKEQQPAQVVVSRVEPKTEVLVDQEDFRMVQRSPRQSLKGTAEVATMNSFQVLQEEEINVGIAACKIGMQGA